MSTTPTTVYQSHPLAILSTDHNVALKFSLNIVISSGNPDLSIYTNDLRIHVVINHNGDPCSIVESSALYEALIQNGSFWLNKQMFTSCQPKNILVPQDGGSFALTAGCGQIDAECTHNRRYFKEMIMYLDYYSENFDVYCGIISTTSTTTDILNTMINLADYAMTCVVENNLRELIPMFFNPGLYASFQEVIPSFNPLCRALGLKSVS